MICFIVTRLPHDTLLGLIQYLSEFAFSVALSVPAAHLLLIACVSWPCASSDYLLYFSGSPPFPELALYLMNDGRSVDSVNMCRQVAACGYPANTASGISTSHVRQVNYGLGFPYNEPTQQRATLCLRLRKCP